MRNKECCMQLPAMGFGGSLSLFKKSPKTAIRRNIEWFDDANGPGESADTYRDSVSNQRCTIKSTKDRPLNKEVLLVNHRKRSWWSGKLSNWGKTLSWTHGCNCRWRPVTRRLGSFQDVGCRWSGWMVFVVEDCTRRLARWCWACIWIVIEID